MIRLLCRWLGCFVSLLAAGYVFLGELNLWPAFWGGLLLTVFYLLLRPIMQTLILPFNLFLLGLLTPVTDALFVLWAASSFGIGLHYWHSLLTALLISLCYLPVSIYKRRKLSPTHS